MHFPTLTAHLFSHSLSLYLSQLWNLKGIGRFALTPGQRSLGTWSTISFFLVFQPSLRNRDNTTSAAPG